MENLIYIIPFVMIFFHIMDDYYLQGILATLKQKSWWEENYPQEIYENDYIVALVMHSFSWSFMIMIPFLLYNIFILGYIHVWYFVFLIFNAIFHGIFDDLKANKKKLNLVADQSLHMIQILVTFLYLFQLFKNL